MPLKYAKVRPLSFARSTNHAAPESLPPAVALDAAALERDGASEPHAARKPAIRRATPACLPVTSMVSEERRATPLLLLKVHAGRRDVDQRLDCEGRHRGVCAAARTGRGRYRSADL